MNQKCEFSQMFNIVNQECQFVNKKFNFVNHKCELVNRKKWICKQKIIYASEMRIFESKLWIKVDICKLEV